MPAIALPYILRCTIAVVLVVIAASPYLLAQQSAEFSWYISPEEFQQEFGPLVLRQKIDADQYIGVEASASCAQCEQYGIQYHLNRTDDLRWNLRLAVVDTTKLQSAGDLKELGITIIMRGSDGSVDSGGVNVRMSVEDESISTDVRSFLESLLSEEEGYTPLPTDQWAVKQIRQLRELRNRSITIYKMGGGLLDVLCQYLIRSDSLLKQHVESMCDKVYPVPLHDCFDTIYKLVSPQRESYGRNFASFMYAFARKYGINMDSINVTILQDMLAMVLVFKVRNADRPDRFYLITTDENEPRLIGIVGGELLEQWDASRVYSISIGNIEKSLVRQLDSSYTNATIQLSYQLSLSRTAPAKSDVVKLWPSKEADDDLQQKDIFSDVDARRVINGMSEFQRQPIYIYEIQGDVKANIIRYRNEQIYEEIELVERIGQIIYDEPLTDCYNTILHAVQSKKTDSGRDFRAFRGEFARRYGVKPKDLDSAGLVKMRDRVMTIMKRLTEQAEYYYLVTTNENRPKPIGLVLLNEQKRDITFDLGVVESSDPERVMTVHSVFTGSAVREQLNALYPGAADTLFRQLPGGSSEDSDWEELDLVKIWPVKEQ